jgi:hypothetical protein
LREGLAVFDQDEEHDGQVGRSPFGPHWVADCSCLWRGPWRETAEEATADLRDHERENRTGEPGAGMSAIARYECRHDDGSVFWASANRPRRPTHCITCGKELQRVEYVSAEQLRVAERDLLAVVDMWRGRFEDVAAEVERLTSQLAGAVDETRRDALLFLRAQCHHAAAEDLSDYFAGALGYDAPAHLTEERSPRERT